MKITGIEAIGVTLPIEAPLRHSYGVHPAFTRTIVRVSTDIGIVGIAETAASPAQVEQVIPVVLGLEPFDLEVIRSRISQRFYWSQDSLTVAAIEMACIDIQGKYCKLPAYSLLGGRVREGIRMAAYCFFRYGSPSDGRQVLTAQEMAAHAHDLVQQFGFDTVKLKAGVLAPELEVETLAAVRERLGSTIRLRIDPNAAWTPITATRLLPALEEIGLEYLEDPAPGIEGMATVRTRTSLPLATNMCVVSFAELGPAIRRGAVDVILSDPWYWGGVRQTQLLGSMCEHFGVSMGMHSGIELGIGMAAMAHVGTTIPSLTLAVDAHYHHLLDDIIVGERLLPTNGVVTPPKGPGWGVEIDEAKLEEYAAVYRSGLHSNLYVAGNGDHPDPWRPDWYPVMPAW